MRFLIVIIFPFEKQVIAFFGFYRYGSLIIRIIRASIRHRIHRKDEPAAFLQQIFHFL